VTWEEGAFARQGGVVQATQLQHYAPFLLQVVGVIRWVVLVQLFS
jgi:hypothetical protein